MADALDPEQSSARSSSRLEWPPTDADLRRLYLEEKRSAIDIAKVYGLSTKNPRSAPYLITYHLKKHGIERRNRIEELQKRTDTLVQAWKAKFPRAHGGEPSNPLASERGEVGQSDGLSRLTVEEKAVIELLQNADLSIRHLEADTKGRVRAAMEGLHWTRGLSLNDIADLVGNKTSGYASYLFKELRIKARPFKEAQLKGIHDKVRIYERKPFSGTDEDKAYLLGISHGDFHVSRPFGDAVSVTTSTTHPALAELFTELFSSWGHVSHYPRYKKDTRTYEWNLQVTLDNSFCFLLGSRTECRQWVTKRESTMLAYLAGLMDAEGHHRISANPRTVGITVGIWNTDTELLDFARECLFTLGYRPMKRYLSSPPGPILSGFRIARKKAYWRVMVGRFDEAQSLLRNLPLRHREKVAIRELALEVSKGEAYQNIAEKVRTLRRGFKEEARQFTRQAELEYLRTHPMPSTPVLCFLQRYAGTFGMDEHYEKRLLSERGFLALHEEAYCLEGLPCVMICAGSNENNIVSILVHESIHHALLWMSDEAYNLTDPLDEIVPFLNSKGVMEDGFSFDG